MKNRIFGLAILLGVLIFSSSQVMSQSVTINIDEKQQQFYGGGGTFDNWNYLWLSMSEENRQKAAKLIAGDINMDYAKIYINGTPETVGSSYDDFVSILNDVKAFNPDIKVQVSCNDFPDELEKKDNNGDPKKGEYDEDITNIFQKIADYYFDILKGFQDRGVVVDELDLLNEPGGVDFAVYYGKLYAEAIPLLKAKIADETQNPTNITMPKVVGVSSWSVLGTVKWFDEWKENLPKAYEQLDIVSTHGYRNGWDEDNYKGIYDYIDGKPFQNNEQTGKLQDGDGLKEIFGSDEPAYIADVSIALRISDAVNGGVNHFFIFNMNNNSGNNAALLQTQHGGAPVKSRVYSGFKQLTSIQPDSSFCIGKSMSSMGNNRALCFRKEVEDTVYVHLTNITADPMFVEIDAKDESSTVYGIKGVEAWVSNEMKDEEKFLSQSFTNAVEKVGFNMSPFSVNSLKIVLRPEGGETTLQSQEINFENIPDQEVGGSYNLEATSNSGLDVSFEVVSGPATINNNSLMADGPGSVTVRAMQHGNNEYFAAEDVYQTFNIEQAGVNVALNKTVTVSSIYQDTDYTGDKAVDGDKSSNSSRWLTDRNGDYPHWIEIDFGGNYEISSMAFYIGHNGYNKPVEDFKFERWDGSQWVTIFEQTGNTDPQYKKSFNPVETEKVRLYMTAGNNPVRMFEIEVFGKEIITGIVDRDILRNLKIFPNPVHGSVLNISSIEKVTNIEVYSAQGIRIPCEFEGNQLKVSHLLKGIYIVKINNVYSRVFIKK